MVYGHRQQEHVCCQLLPPKDTFSNILSVFTTVYWPFKHLSSSVLWGRWLLSSPFWCQDHDLLSMPLHTLQGNEFCSNCSVCVKYCWLATYCDTPVQHADIQDSWTRLDILYRCTFLYYKLCLWSLIQRERHDLHTQPTYRRSLITIAKHILYENGQWSN